MVNYETPWDHLETSFVFVSIIRVFFHPLSFVIFRLVFPSFLFKIHTLWISFLDEEPSSGYVFSIFDFDAKFLPAFAFKIHAFGFPFAAGNARLVSCTGLLTPKRKVPSFVEFNCGLHQLVVHYRRLPLPRSYPFPLSCRVVHRASGIRSKLLVIPTASSHVGSSRAVYK